MEKSTNASLSTSTSIETWAKSDSFNPLKIPNFGFENQRELLKDIVIAFTGQHPIPLRFYTGPGTPQHVFDTHYLYDAACFVKSS